MFISTNTIKYILFSFLALALLASCAKPATFKVEDLKTTKLIVSFGPKGGVAGKASNYPVNVFFRLKDKNVYKNYKYADQLPIGDFKPIGYSNIFATDYTKIEDDRIHDIEWTLPVSFKYVFNGKPAGRKNAVVDHSDGISFTVKYGKNLNKQETFHLKVDPSRNAQGGIVVLKEDESTELPYRDKGATQRTGVFYDSSAGTDESRPLVKIHLDFSATVE